MKTILERLFLEHPRTVNETYRQHQAFAFGFAWRLFRASIAALVHAIVPAWHEKTASKAIMQMHKKLTTR